MTNFGDTTTALGDIDNYGGGDIILRKFTAFPGGDVSSLSLWAKTYGSGAGTFRGVVYSDSAGSPGSLLWISEEFAITTGMTSYAYRTPNKYSDGHSSTLAAQTLWIGSWYGGGYISVNDSDSGGTGLYKSGVTYSSTAEPGSVPDTTYNVLTRVYITYTSGGATFTGLTVTRP